MDTYTKDTSVDVYSKANQHIAYVLNPCTSIRDHFQRGVITLNAANSYAQICPRGTSCEYLSERDKNLFRVLGITKIGIPPTALKHFIKVVTSPNINGGLPRAIAGVAWTQTELDLIKSGSTESGFTLSHYIQQQKLAGRTVFPFEIEEIPENLVMMFSSMEDIAPPDSSIYHRAGYFEKESPPSEDLDVWKPRSSKSRSLYDVVDDYSSDELFESASQQEVDDLDRDYDSDGPKLFDEQSDSDEDFYESENYPESVATITGPTISLTQDFPDGDSRSTESLSRPPSPDEVWVPGEISTESDDILPSLLEQEESCSKFSSTFSLESFSNQYFGRNAGHIPEVDENRNIPISGPAVSVDHLEESYLSTSTRTTNNRVRLATPWGGYSTHVVFARVPPDKYFTFGNFTENESNLSSGQDLIVPPNLSNIVVDSSLHNRPCDLVSIPCVSAQELPVMYFGHTGNSSIENARPRENLCPVTLFGNDQIDFPHDQPLSRRSLRVQRKRGHRHLAEDCSVRKPPDRII
jgi:hypothetical protein